LIAARLALTAIAATALACAPATFFVDDTPVNGGDASVDGSHADAAPNDAPGRTNGNPWVAPDGCSDDPACIVCTNPNECPIYDNWQCFFSPGASVGRCSMCSAEFGCNSNTQCIYGRCLEPCGNNNRCTTQGLTCTVDHVCAQCSNTGDCSPGLVCNQTHQCVECQSSGDCPDKSIPFCNTGQKRADLAGFCVACLMDTDCGDAGEVCSPLGNCSLRGGPNGDP
jgi:hypothetical protein